MVATCKLNKYEVQGLCQRYWSEAKGLKNLNEGENSLKVVRYKLKPTSDAPAGFLGHHQYLDVQIAVKDGSQEESIKKIRFFVKSAPEDIETRMQYLEDFGVFKKEISIYSEVLPHIQSIFPGIAAKCYYADNNLLIFEDLVSQGYKMGSTQNGLLDYEHLHCALKCLAALHASSIVLEVRQDKKLNEMFADALKENAYPSDSHDKQLRVQNFLKVVDVIMEMIKSMPKYSSKLDYILEELPACMRTIFEKAKVSTKYKNVLLHGDLWSNNLMFQYGKHGDIPLQCRFVDFQLARYGPPVLDVMTVLTIPTSREFREKYLDALLADYYRFMTEFLKYEGLSVDDYITKEQYAEGVEEFRLSGLIESCLFSHLTVLSPVFTNELTGSATGFEDYFSQKRVEICMKAFNADAVYRERLTDMIEDLVDRYILK